MRIIDTHCHIYLPEFDDDRDQVVGRAQDAGIEYMLMPNVDSTTIESMSSVQMRYQGYCLPMMGLHPTSVKENFRQELERVREELSRQQFYGIGETGIDLYWDKSFLKEQVISFRVHLHLAEEYSLPVVIHARESLDVIIDVIRDFGAGRVRGIFHAFSGTVADALTVTGLGFTLGIGGVVTFKNSRLDEAVKGVGLDNIVLETDAPYLAPVPYRGKRNESSYLTLVAEKISGILNTDPEEVAERTTANAIRIFNL